jgi:hypothetical protein
MPTKRDQAGQQDAAIVATLEAELEEAIDTYRRIAQERGLIDEHGNLTAKGRKVNQRLWRMTHPGYYPRHG